MNLLLFDMFILQAAVFDSNGCTPQPRQILGICVCFVYTYLVFVVCVCVCLLCVCVCVFVVCVCVCVCVCCVCVCACAMMGVVGGFSIHLSYIQSFHLVSQAM